MDRLFADGTVNAAEAGHGPPLVLFHSLLSDRASFDAIVPELQTSFRVIVPELPGLTVGVYHYVSRDHCLERRCSLNRVANAAKQAGVPCDTIQVEDEQPYQAIIATAKDRGCDLIVMASHGRSGLSAVVLGSVTNKVLTHTKTPVLVCH